MMFTHASDLITYVILSPEPVSGDNYRSIHYLNHVSKVSDHIQFHIERMSAVRKVSTPYFTFLDSDDPIPQGVRAPKNAGILYGTEVFCKSDGTQTTKEPRPFNWMASIQSQFHIHKAVCNTQYAKCIIDLLPYGLYNTEVMVFSLLALWKGHEIDKDFIYEWNIHDGGIHHWRDAKRAVRNSTRWLFDNKRIVMEKLNQIA